MSNYLTSSGTTSSQNHNRQRQYTHLQAQLAQLNAHLADMENLLRMTAVQADHIRGLGGWWGGLFMASSKILGEESSVAGPANTTGEKEEDSMDVTTNSGTTGITDEKQRSS